MSAADIAVAPAVAFHAGIVSARFYETWDFYTTELGFRTLAENDGYVRLGHPSGAELSVLQHELDGEWSELVNATDARGVWLTIHVDDPDAEFRRLRTAGVEIVPAPGNAKWGRMQFVLRDPNGVLIFLAAKPAVAEAFGDALACG